MQKIKRFYAKMKTNMYRRQPRIVQRKRIPTMLTDMEQEYLFKYMAKDYTHAGEVVDLGCWMGGSTISMAQGLRRNRRGAERSGKIHAFDLFEWTHWMESNYGNVTPNIEVGKSFVSVYKEYTSKWEDLIEIHSGDLNEIPWTGEKIEFVFVDAMKSWDLANVIVSKFYPYIIPNKSMLIHQDFVHWNTPWILLLTYRFRSFLEPVEWIRGSTSYVFRCIGDPSAYDFKENLNFDSFSKEEIGEAFAYCREIMPNDTPARFLANLEAAEINCHIYMGNLEYADQALRKAEQHYNGPLSELRHIGPRLTQVEVLRLLIVNGGEVKVSVIIDKSFLSEDNVREGIQKLSQRDLVDLQSDDSVVSVTDAGRSWIDRSFQFSST